MIDNLLTPKEVAKILNMSRNYVYRLVKTGKLPAYRTPKFIRIRPEDLERFILENSSKIESDRLQIIKKILFLLGKDKK